MRSLKYPTIPELEQAFLLADKPFEIADGRLLAEHCTKFIIKNSRIKGHINTRRTAVASWDWDIVPYDASDALIAARSKKRLSKVINRIIPSRINTCLYGHYAIGIEFVAHLGERIPIIAKNYKPTDILACDGNNIKYADGDKIFARSKISLLDIGNGDINPVVTIMESDGEDFRGGILLSMAITEIIRLDMLQEWVNWAKKQKGMIQGVDMGADKEEREIAELAMKQLLKENYVFTSDVIEYKFHQIANSTAGSSFKEIHQELNNSLAIAILGQANTSELPAGGGSRAALEVQRLVSADIMYSDVIATTALINEQLLPIDFWFNASSKEPPYEFKIMLAEQTDYESNAIIIREALAAGVPIIKTELYSKLGLTVPKDTDEVVQGVQNL